MNLRVLVWRELWERKNQLMTSFLAIAFGAAAIVAIHSIAHYSEKKVQQNLDALGANILILPRDTVISDYYTADIDGPTMPEEVLEKLHTTGLEGLENLSPKLSARINVEGRTLALTGILPRNEIMAKSSWGGISSFNPLATCEEAGSRPVWQSDEEKLAHQRYVEDMEQDEVFLGADAAELLGKRKDDKITIQGRELGVRSVLPATGTIDDGRIFAHLATVQELTGKGRVLSAIEIMGCCQKVREGLTASLSALLPNQRVVTVNHVIDTQIRTNDLMRNLSWLFLGLMILVGGASIATYMYASVHERRREIGTMMALGAKTSTLQGLFLAKAALLGVGGGLIGYVVGTALAVLLGPWLAGVPVMPRPLLLFLAVGVSLLLALLASWLPARRAARLDPFTTLREV